MDNEFCQNSLCDNPAYKEVEVSLSEGNTETRFLCVVCEEIYSTGVQQGHFQAIRDLRKLGFKAAADALACGHELGEENVEEDVVAPDLELEVIDDVYDIFCSSEQHVTVSEIDQIAGEVKDSIISDPPCVLLRDSEGKYYSLMIHGAHTLRKITAEEANDQYDLWDECPECGEPMRLYMKEGPDGTSLDEVFGCPKCDS